MLRLGKLRAKSIFLVSFLCTLVICQSGCESKTFVKQVFNIERGQILCQLDNDSRSFMPMNVNTKTTQNVQAIKPSKCRSDTEQRYFMT